MSLLVTMMALLATTAPLAWGVAAWVLRRAEALRLVQMPNHRSSHDHPTPNGGGLGIVVAGSLAGIALVLLSGWMVGGLLLGLAAVLAAVGLRDDMAHLPADYTDIINVHGMEIVDLGTQGVTNYDGHLADHLRVGLHHPGRLVGNRLRHVLRQSGDLRRGHRDRVRSRGIFRGGHAEGHQQPDPHAHLRRRARRHRPLHAQSKPVGLSGRPVAEMIQ